MSRTRLTKEDVALWRKVADQAQRLHPENPKQTPSFPKPKPVEPPKRPIPDFTVGARAATRIPRNDLALGISERVARQPVQMDQKAFVKLKRGKIFPEGKIDLHGMTMSEAHPALIDFLFRSHAEGKRLVLVITGKGKQKLDDGPIPTRRGVLKHQVPQWLTLPSLRPVVLQVAEAHVKHGGKGAYYVYLRRK
ncbi:Smr/MutS family protein [Pseudopelagicola sp. nBUS_19]|uniref:Smr/MutS family protein n=1 Tax=Pseudopelagicola sp. nBUS_19 TaxID=3395316 RepID=UPI003EB89542